MGHKNTRGRRPLLLPIPTSRYTPRTPTFQARGATFTIDLVLVNSHVSTRAVQVEMIETCGVSEHNGLLVTLNLQTVLAGEIETPITTYDTRRMDIDRLDNYLAFQIWDLQIQQQPVKSKHVLNKSRDYFRDSSERLASRRVTSLSKGSKHYHQLSRP